ncbi:excinuclease ABC subunit UvrA [Plantactinospora sp. KLBMP9567]|uniref:excinuclease ABC subunit UvrA n=1 Tax=Plantactinospora sp. KLBMP9567 TaxID=3085900 RepID=UPI002980D9CC|nr:excinuclease ABC subunit UvrA [Plantactinospora sp. KLBMP9567]MDW5330854.1 excinuclease ABC subunit UvrA [Plantactinospora sp. KLBMP9567]
MSVVESPARSAPVTEWIRVTGAREHNLAAVDVEIPKRRLTVVTGVSGSGKSSLVFETIAVEGQRQMTEMLPMFVRNFLPSSARPAVDLIEHLPATVAIDQRPLTGGPRSTVGTITDIAPLLRLLFARVGEPFVGYPDAFSFNMPAGMCPECEGRGEVTDVDLAAFLDPTRSLNQGALLAPTFKVGSRDWHLLVASGRFDPDKPVSAYSERELDDLLYATDGTVPLEVAGSTLNLSYEGAVVKFRRRYLDQQSEPAERTRRMVGDYTTTVPCRACGGSRLSPLALSSRVGGHNIAELAAMEAEELLGVLAGLEVPAAKPVLDTLVAQVGHLVEIGLGYLSLDRRTGTLSGGESQRVKIVRHLSSSLNDLLYVFDEPSVGLHPRDVHRLTNLLRTLRDKGNTVVVVEHDRDVIAAADHVLDLGPGAGTAGGRVVYAGGLGALTEADTLTGRAMTQGTRLKEAVRTPTGVLPIVNARTHNLRDLSLNIPAGVLTVLAGVAGAGKSSLVGGAFRVQHPEAVIVDQSMPHANRRSTAVTYSGVADQIRAEFARANQVSPALFSANSSGACATCAGLGVVQTDFGALEGVSLVCQTCDGRRFSDEVLGYRLRGRTISDVLEMTVAQGREFFAGNRRIAPVLAAMADVGLDYLRLGQPLTSLSGGECQRIKLATHLHGGAPAYVLDEPTTGLHMADVGRLLGVLDRLVDEYAATVLVIEHNLDVVAHADWVVELGPEGGSRGGRVLYQGEPRGLVEQDGSPTGVHLRRALGVAGVTA